MHSISVSERKVKWVPRCDTCGESFLECEVKKICFEWFLSAVAVRACLNCVWLSFYSSVDSIFPLQVFTYQVPAHINFFFWSKENLESSDIMNAFLFGILCMHLLLFVHAFVCVCTFVLISLFCIFNFRYRLYEGCQRKS